MSCIAMPKEIKYFNGTHEACDAISGPCCCGAWHSISEWPHRLKDMNKHEYKSALRLIDHVKRTHNV